MTAVITIHRHADRRRVQFLDDYCPRCNPLGHNADSRVRLATLTEPTTVTWSGGKRVHCEYDCRACGHRWGGHDIWTAEQAGFGTKRRRSIA